MVADRVPAESVGVLSRIHMPSVVPRPSLTPRVRSSEGSPMPSALASLRAQLPGFRLGLFLAAAVTVHLIAAWFNGGFLSWDEHYQIIEFAQYKLGRQSPAGLAWEFAETMRPALQPWIAAGAIRLGDALGVASPFAIAFVLRAMSTLLGLGMSFELCARTCRAIENPP